MGLLLIFHTVNDGIPRGKESTEAFTAYEAFLQYDAAQYTPTATVLFEAIMKSSAGTTVQARLYNITGSTSVASSELETASTSFTRLRTSSLALTGTKEYRTEVRTTSGTTTSVQAARLVVQQ